MSKLEVFDGKQTTWEGLWWHPECGYFSSAAFSLGQLRKFKGSVRLYVKKNRYYNNGENGRPNYLFFMRDAKAEIVEELEAVDDSGVNSLSCIDKSEIQGEFHCSNCGHRFLIDDIDSAFYAPNYCPECSAKIKKVDA